MLNNYAERICKYLLTFLHPCSIYIILHYIFFIIATVQSGFVNMLTVNIDSINKVQVGSRNHPQRSYDKHCIYTLDVRNESTLSLKTLYILYTVRNLVIVFLLRNSQFLGL